MDDELFFAWLDGELDADRARRVEAEVAADPALQAKADAHRRLKEGLGGAFAPIAAAPVPERLRAAARPAATVVDFNAARQRRRPIPAAAQWAAMAATLAIGLVGGAMFAGRQTAPVTFEGGRLVAAAGLEEALTTRLASAPAATGTRIGLTYRAAGGEICRTFSDGGASGLACREGGDWRIRGLVQDAREGTGEFRMASGPDPQIAAMVEESIAGQPFDAVAEQAAMERGWR